MKLDLDSILSEFEEYSKIGTVDQIKELISRYHKMEESLNRYQMYGTPDDINDLIKSYRSVSKSGPNLTNEDINNLNEYRRLGSIPQIKDLIEKYNEVKTNDTISRLASKYEVSEGLVSKILDKVDSFSKADELLSDIVGESNNKSNDSYRDDRRESARMINYSDRLTSNRTARIKSLLNKYS